MKVFLSTPFGSKSAMQVMATITTCCIQIREIFGEDVEVIDNYDYIPERDDHLDCMIKALEKISQCNLVAFSSDWEKASGCRIEMEVCKKYGIPVVILN